MSKVYIFFADGFEDIEGLTVVDLMRRAGIPGGMPGTKYLEEYKPLTDLLTGFYQKGGKVAAICAAPGVFERLGFLKGRNATSYPSVMEQLTSAKTSLEPVVVDGNVTTSRGLGTAIDFSLSLIRQLEGRAKAEEIAEFYGKQGIYSGIRAIYGEKNTGVFTVIMLYYRNDCKYIKCEC